MARGTIFFGLALCVASIFILLATPTNRISSEFMPIVIGIPLFICGVISLHPRKCMAWIRRAMLVASLAAIGTLVGFCWIATGWFRGVAILPMPLGIAGILAVSLTGYSWVSWRFLQYQLSRKTRVLQRRSNP